MIEFVRIGLLESHARRVAKGLKASPAESSPFDADRRGALTPTPERVAQLDAADRKTLAAPTGHITRCQDIKAGRKVFCEHGFKVLVYRACVYGWL